MTMSKKDNSQIPMEASLTQGEILVLSVLSEEPNYPYYIQKIIEERGARKWMDIGFSSIYHALDRLEKKKMVASKYHTPETKDETESKRRQRIFSLTLNGKQCLKANVAYVLGQYVDKSPSSIGFANMLLFTETELKKLLKIRKNQIQKRINNVLERQNQNRITSNIGNNDARLMVDLLFEYAILQHNAELEFLEMVKEKWLNR